MISMDSNVKDRLVEYLDYKDISKNKFAKTIGVSPAYVNSIRKSIQPDKISFLEYFQQFADSKTNIYINYDRAKVDEANRKVIDYVNQHKK